MDDEWEEELVVVELAGIINNDFSSKYFNTCKILDIDSEKPMMQVGQYVFAGEYEDTLGTCVLFEEIPKKGKPNSSPNLKYMCHTAKKLVMQRVFLTEKKTTESDTGSSNHSEQEKAVCSSSEETNANRAEEPSADMENTD
ncbi:general transcription factor 3C polypeptide 6 isoform X2 [Gouania willdenowi]|uniref:general transcription factor 3C polypeptide 6 isoform X2 n=1 Tax=Gouania willdenowi TaxID=441366 RepID=UPI0010559E1C|nr:general transcription factor 3C polypeptide 6 isoform X2 [Gouania willdenowi]